MIDEVKETGLSEAVSCVEFLCLFLKFCCQMKPIKLSRLAFMAVTRHYVTSRETSGLTQCPVRSLDTSHHLW